MCEFLEKFWDLCILMPKMARWTITLNNNSKFCYVTQWNTFFFQSWTVELDRRKSSFNYILSFHLVQKFCINVLSLIYSYRSILICKMKEMARMWLNITQSFMIYIRDLYFWCQYYVYKIRPCRTESIYSTQILNNSKLM